MLRPLPPLDPDRLFAAIDFTSSPTVLVAVSGGGDSMALLDLAAAHLSAGRLAAVTIDHGLRAASAAEADAVARHCRERGIRHVTLRWDGEKPATGVQAAARSARRHLLAKAARELDASIVLAGHTADDQAETVAMRAARGPGRGLAGMAPATLVDGRLWLVRPLLGVRRTDLRDHLVRRGIGWADDPSNDDPAYERVRARRALGDTAQVETFLAMAGSAAAERIRLGEAAARLVSACAMPAPGLIRLDPAQFADAERDAAIYALRLLLATTGGAAHLPDEARVAALLIRLGEPTLRTSLSRTTIERRGGAVYLRREARGLPPAGPAEDGRLWDGRFRLSGFAGRTTIAPLGMTAASRLSSDAFDAPRVLVRAALATLPGFLGDAERAAPPPPPRKGEGNRSRRPAFPWTSSSLWPSSSGLTRGSAAAGDIGSCPTPATAADPRVRPEDDGAVGEDDSAGGTEASLARSPSPCGMEVALQNTALVGSLAAIPVSAPFARLLPSFDLAPASALAALVGGELPPSPPFPRHKVARP